MILTADSTPNNGLLIERFSTQDGVTTVCVGGVAYSESVIITTARVLPWAWTPPSPQQNWRKALQSLTWNILISEEKSEIATMLKGIEILLVGTPTAFSQPLPQFMADCYHQRIGLEVMNAGSACRTYNLLSTDGRKVALALMQA